MIDVARLRRDLAAYSPEMGVANRDLALVHHSAARHAHELVELFRGLAPRTRLAPDALTELARLAALQWDTYVRLDAAEYWGRQALAENRRLDEERSAAVAVAAERTRERDALVSERESLLGTRRYRFAQALARPLDLMRRRSR